MPCLLYRSQQRERKVRAQPLTEKELPQLPKDSISHSFNVGAHGRRDETIDSLVDDLRIATARLHQLGGDYSNILHQLEKILKPGDEAVRVPSSRMRKRVHWLD